MTLLRQPNKQTNLGSCHKLYHINDKILHLKCDVRGTSATTHLEVNYSKHLFKRTFNFTPASLKMTEQSSGRLRLNLNPLNLVRWIDSYPFDKTWKPGWNDSTWVNRFNGRAMNLEWIFIMTPSRARKSFSKASPYFFCTDPAGDRFNAVRLFHVISEYSAERDSLDKSSAFLIKGAQCGRQTLKKEKKCPAGVVS